MSEEIKAKDKLVIEKCHNTYLLKERDHSTFPGSSWKLKSIRDKSGKILAGLTIKADEPTSLTSKRGRPFNFTITATLTFTETRYTFSLTTIAAITGHAEETYTPEKGTYSVSGSTLTVVSDDPEEGTQTFTVSTSFQAKHNLPTYSFNI